MYKKKVLFVIATLLVVAMTAATHQGVVSSSQQNMEKKEKEEKKERAIEVSVAPVRYDGEIKEQFKVGEPVRVGVWMLNTSAEPVAIMKGNFFFNSRLFLRKDGHPVKYRAGVARRVKSADDNGPITISVITIVLEPNVRTGVDILDLRNWYDPLEPGHYELTVRWRFRHKGGLKEANKVMFEVVP